METQFAVGIGSVVWTNFRGEGYVDRGRDNYQSIDRCFLSFLCLILVF